MGGCRCTFRDCGNNSSNSPGMHFFHFPYKNWSRCEKWAFYSANIDFLSLTVDKLRNKVVCETHFRDECFMNYKKERLVQNAVPTLMRLSNNYALDYEESENPKPKVLEPTVSKHLVPPEKRTSEEEDENKISKASSETEDEITIETLDELPSSPSESFEVTLSNYVVDNSPPAKVKKYDVPKILNFSPAVARKLPRPRAHSNNKKDYGRAQVIPAAPVVVEQHVEEVLIDNASDFQTFDEKEQLLNIVTLEEELSADPTPDIISKDEYLKTIEDQANEIEKLKQQLAEKAITNVKAGATQSETITTTRIQENVSNNAPLSKAQLFNGIKKYLSPSMTALVRMEMFGGPERQWKPDEKIVARELLQLGEQVFHYVRDEWRFRLPPKREVEQWLNEQSLQDDEDL